MSLKRIKLITFDATNTLLKFRIPPWQHYANVAQDYGYKNTNCELKSRFFSSYKIMWDDHPNFGRNSISWEEWWRRVVKLTFDGLIPVETHVDSIASRLIIDFSTTKCWIPAIGGEKLLQLIRSHGISVGAISNFDPRLISILENINLHSKFNFILTSYETGFCKPDRKIFDMALKMCNTKVLPSECLHIGDNVEKDYEGAKAAGWFALMIGDQLNERPPASNHVFKNLEELSFIIEQNKLTL